MTETQEIAAAQALALQEAAAAERKAKLELAVVGVLPKKDRALACLAAGGLVREAAEFAGVSAETLRRWRHADADYAAAWELAWQDGADQLEDTLQTCAEHACHDPRYQTSLIFSLKNRRPDRWRDVQDLRHTGDIRQSQTDKGLLVLISQVREAIVGPKLLPALDEVDPRQDSQQQAPE